MQYIIANSVANQLFKLTVKVFEQTITLEQI